MRLSDSSNGEVSRDDAVGVGVGVGMGVTGGDDRAGTDNLSSSSRPFDAVKLKLVSFDWFCNAHLDAHRCSKCR